MSDPAWGTQEWHRQHPIYYKPEELKDLPEVLIERIRRDLGTVRGKLHDIKFAYGWSDRIQTAEEGLTLVISYLHGVKEEIEKVRKASES